MLDPLEIFFQLWPCWEQYYIFAEVNFFSIGTLFYELDIFPNMYIFVLKTIVQSKEFNVQF